MHFAARLLGLALATAPCVTAQQVDFNRDVRPILSDRCFRCHGPDASTREADLRLDLREHALDAIEPGAPDESELFLRVTDSDVDFRMPPVEAKMRAITAAEAEVLERWIAQGAPYAAHWSYTPLPPAAPPATSAHPIDAFVADKLESLGLRAAPAADPVTLVRRLSYDLLGLPPTPETAAAFVTQAGAGGEEFTAHYASLVEEMLASPRHAERLAVHWLDLVRYADTVGYHGDQEHSISPYRDYVLRAFRDNIPFDQFTREQLAGDLLPEPTQEQLIATGYNRVLQTTHEFGLQKGEYLAKYAADRVRNLGAVWLGTTTGCCECHDHKYDPITARDFYSLAAFFADIDEDQTFAGKNRLPTERLPELAVVTALDLERDPDGEHAPRLTMVTASKEPRTTRVLRRGDWQDEGGEVVQPAAPHFLPQIATGDRRATRLDLANWLTARDNPLTARVFVNRLWQMFFGRGLSRVLDDLGAQGEPPTHPELLDWLAREFVDSGWDVRHVIRLIVTSEAYRRSSMPVAGQADTNPGNRWIARQGRYRLPAEFVRDHVLAVSGLLVHDFGGASVKPYQPAGYYVHLNFPRRKYKRHTGDALYRRSVYVHWQRQFLHPLLRAFDASSREECTAQRPISNSPAAALALLNEPAMVEAARVFAARILAEGGTTDAARITFGWQCAVSRAPTSTELDVVTSLLRAHRAVYAEDIDAARALTTVGDAPPAEGLAPDEHAAWTSVARVILNLDEGIRRH